MARSALITGAGSGIGRAVALALAERGYALTLVGRNEATLRETAALTKVAARIAPGDVCDAAQIDAAFDAAISAHGRIDLVFNNAGIASGGPIEDFDLAAWRRVIDTNVTGAFHVVRAAFRVMKDQSPRGGRIINNGSLSADRPRPNSVAYTTSKHAITGLTKSASLDGRKYDIACGQIDIGNASSPMTARMTAGVPQADGSIAAEPVMDVAAVGQAIVYMDSLPLEANVQFMTLMATKMPFIGRG
jgi:NAD(P)-dependent dehydrogenase (short-subunit alcohol dehydrogenase family)